MFNKIAKWVDSPHTQADSEKQARTTSPRTQNIFGVALSHLCYFEQVPWEENENYDLQEKS